MSTSRWHLDRTGFPYLMIPGRDTAMSLLPVTKHQLERWIADPAGPGDEWYEQLLQASPRASWRKLNSPAWQLLATGLLPQECERFAQWLGLGYRLPDASEWRSADRTVQLLQNEDLHDLLRVLSQACFATTRQLLQTLMRNQRSTWGKLSFFQQGILEWVSRPQGEPGGLGRPSPELPLQLILDPQAFDPVVPLKAERQVAFGVRLLCSPRGRR